MQIRHVRELLRSLRPKHTILLSTHILQEVEHSCDRVIMIHHGRILAMDTPQNLTQQLRASSLVHVEMQAQGEVTAKFEALSGVRKAVEEDAQNDWRRLSLRVEARHDVREAVIDLATAEGWKIRELHRQLPSLEDVFVELAAADPAKAGGSSR